MAAVTRLGSSFTTTAGNKTVTATPAVGDLIVVVVANSGRTTAQAPTITDNNSSGTYTQVIAATKNGSADSLWVFVRTALIGSASSTIFTMTQSGDTGGGFGSVLKVTGMTKVGAAAVRQSLQANNQSTGTPSVTLASAILTTNPAIGAVLTGQTGTTNTAPPTGWAEHDDAGYSTPSTGREVCSIDSGSTLTTVAWTAATTSAFCALVVELDSSSSNVDATFTLTGGGILTSVRQKGSTAGITFPGGGVLTSVRQKGGQRAQLLTGGGVLTRASRKDALRAQLLTGGGILVTVRQKGGRLTVQLPGGGVLTWSYSVSGGGVPNANGTFILTGGGVLATTGQKAAFRTQTLTGGGTWLAAVLAARQGAFLLSGGGVLVVAPRAGHLADPDLTGGGILQWLARTGRFATINLTGGGQLIFQGENVALTNLGEVMDAIALAIEAQGVTERTYAYPAESISPPCAVVAYPTDIEFDVTYNRGADRCVIPVYFIVGRVVERSARDALAGIITGATGIKEALDGDLGGTVQTLRVMDMKIMNVQVSGIDYLAAQFNAEVYQ
jgi:hypothetical protein